MRHAKVSSSTSTVVYCTIICSIMITPAGSSDDHHDADGSLDLSTTQHGQRSRKPSGAAVHGEEPAVATTGASAHVFSPVDFGAKFDGVTDDSSAWIRMLSAALNASSFGVQVSVPPGRTVLSQTLEIHLAGNKALSLRGAGSDVTELVWTAPVDGLTVSFDDAATNSRDAFASGGKFSFEGISLVSGVPFVQLRTSASTPSGNILRFSSTSGVSVGMFVTSFVDAANITLGTFVAAVTDGTVHLSANVTGPVEAGGELSFVRVAGSALTINGDSNQQFGLESPELYIRDTSIHGFTGGSLFTPGGSWLNGIVCNNQTEIRIDSAFVTFGRELPVGVGLTIRGSYPTRLADDHHITNLRTIAGEIGILLGDGHPGFEGLMISDSSLVGPSRYGIWANTDHSIEDQLTVTGTHINAGHAALAVDGMTQVSVSNCFFIVGGGVGGDVAAINFTDVGWYALTGNLFQMMDLQKSERSVWGIVVDNAEHWGDKTWGGTISGNVIQEPSSGGIWLKNFANNVLVSGNMITTAGQPARVDSTTAATHFIGNMANGKIWDHPDPSLGTLLSVERPTSFRDMQGTGSLPETSANDGSVSLQTFCAPSWLAKPAADISTCLQAAIDHAATTGALLSIPATPKHVGYWAISKTIRIGNGTAAVASALNSVRIHGAGSAGIYGTFGSYLSWTGAAGGTMIEIAGRINNVELSGLNLCGMNLAANILEARAIRFSRIRDIYYSAFRAVGFGFYGAARPKGTTTFYNNNIMLDISFIYGTTDHASARAIAFDGVLVDSSDTWLSTVRNSRFESFGPRGVAIYLGFSDNLLWEQIHGEVNVTAKGCGLMFDALPGGLDYNNFPTGHTFVKTAIENTCVVNEDETHHIGKNTFLDFGTTDNELIPEHPNLIGITDQGMAFGGYGLVSHGPPPSIHPEPPCTIADLVGGALAGTFRATSNCTHGQSFDLQKLPPAPNGYVCAMDVRTDRGGVVIHQVADTKDSASFKIGQASGALLAGQVVQFKCTGY